MLSGGMRATPASSRLSYVPVTDADVARLHAHWNDPDVRRHLWDDQPVALATVGEVVAASCASFASSGYGLWSLADADGFVGMCGLRDTDGGEVEVLYSIEPSRWANGFASEAAASVLDHAFTALGLTRVLGGVDDANHASRRVLVKLGMTPLESSHGGAAHVGWLAIDRARWRRPTSA